jgi:mono/diheme cytochrome c family protein
MRIVLSAAALLSLVLVNWAPEQVLSSNANHGAYLAEHALMCIQCHSPREESGNLIPSQFFMGAPIPVTPPSWGRDWALVAPRIAGIPGYAGKDALRLLTQGIARTGAQPRPPMPPFRLSDQDAHDIYSFLISIR